MGMLELQIPDIELFDEKTEEFVNIKGTTLQLEHSLISISKWESKWHKPFLGKGDKTDEEIIDYIRCMSINKIQDPQILKYIPQDFVKKVVDYIQEPMTATWFSEEKKNAGGSKEIVTSELIYYWMIAMQIPVEFQRWHLNRLLTLIRVCNIKNEPPKKMSKRELASRNRSLNEARKAAMHTRG